MNPLNYSAGQQIKAFVAAVIAGLTALQTSLPDGVDAGEWLTVAIATLVAYGAVFGVPNRDA